MAFVRDGARSAAAIPHLRYVLVLRTPFGFGYVTQLLCKYILSPTICIYICTDIAVMPVMGMTAPISGRYIWGVIKRKLARICFVASFLKEKVSR